MILFKKYNIDFKSLLKKGVKPIKEQFSVLLLCGRMGSGKTYLSIKFAIDLLRKDKSFTTIRTNIKTLKMPKDLENIKIIYFDNIRELYNDNCNTIDIIDELGKIFPKECRMDKDFYNYLQHSRKQSRVCLLIHQEFLQTPTWIRGAVREVFTSFPIPLTHFVKSYRGVPYLNDDCEWSVDPTMIYIYKRNKSITILYDTFEMVTTTYS